MSYNLIDFAKELLTGSLQQVDETTWKQRAELCMNCEHRIKTPLTKLGNCGKCGCFLDIKTTLKNASCPLNKWTAKEV